MKHLMLMLSSCAIALVPSLASADPAPKGPDFIASPPTRSVDRSSAASWPGERPIAPTDVVQFRKDSDVITPAALSQIEHAVMWLKGSARPTS